MADELKGIVEDIQKAFHDFRQENDKRLEKIQKGGQADPMLEEKVNKMSDHINSLEEKRTELEKRLEQAETAAARKGGMNSADDEKLEAKARQFAAMCAKERGVAVPSDFGSKEFGQYKSSFFEWMRKGDHLSLDASKALSVGTDPDGGYFVEADTSGRIVTAIYETSPMRQVASQQTISTDALEGIYDLDEASFGWVSEQGSRTETGTPEIAKWRIPTHEMYAEPRATQKVLDDAAINLEQWLQGKVTDKFARAENTAFVSGDGIDKPRGFTTYGAGTSIPGTIERFYTGANGAFEATPDGGDKLLDMIYGTKQGYRQNSRWFMNRSTVAGVRKLKDSDGQYLWQPGLGAGQPSQLLGFPILEFEDMDDYATTNGLAIAFGDMREAYQIVDRMGIRILRDPYTSKPFVKFYMTKRVGGDVVNFEAIKLLQFGSA